MEKEIIQGSHENHKKIDSVIESKNSIIQEIISIDHLSHNIDHKTHRLTICIHHGETDANKDHHSSSSKTTDTPLNQQGKNEVKDDGMKTKELLGPNEIGHVMIHVSPDIVRNIETARIIAQEIGIAFPNDDEIQIIKNGNKGLLSKFPQIIFTEALRSPRKTVDSVGKVNYPRVFSITSNNTTTESPQFVRGVSTDYITKTQENLTEFHHIYIVNRTGVEGFKDYIHGRKSLEYDFTSPTGEMVVMPVNHKGLPITSYNPELIYHLDINRVSSELLSLAQQYQIGIDHHESGVEYINQLNEIWYKLCNFVGYCVENKKINILVGLLNKFGGISNKLISFLLSEFGDNENVQKCINIYLEQTNTTDISLLQILYQLGDDALRKKYFEKIYKLNKDKLITGNITSNKDFTIFYQEIEKKNELLSGNSLQVNSFALGQKNISEIYCKQTFTDNTKTIFLSDEIIESVCKMRKNESITILGAGGSGKSTFSKYLFQTLLNKGVHVDYIKAGEILEKKIENHLQILIIDGFDEVNVECHNLIYELMGTHTNCSLIILGRSIDRTKMSTNNSIFSIEMPSFDEFEIAKEKYSCNFDSEGERKYFIQFIEYVIPHLSKNDLTYQMLDILGMISQSRFAYVLLSKKNIKRSDIFEIYLKTQQEKSFDKFKKIHPTIISNDLVGENFDKVRCNFMQFISTNFAIYESNKNSPNKLQFRLKTLEELYNDRVDVGDNDKFIYDRAINKQHIDGGSFNNLLQQRFLMFIESLVATGFLQKNAGNDMYEIPHKSIDDYMRFTKIDGDKIKETSFFKDLENRGDPMGRFNFLNKNSKILNTLIQDGTYKNIDDVKTQGLKEIEYNLLDLNRLLDSVFFNGFDCLFEVILLFKSTLGDRAGKGLQTYISENSSQIISYFSKNMLEKHAQSDITKINSFMPTFEHFLVGGSHGYGGPTMREMAATGLGLELFHFLDHIECKEGKFIVRGSETSLEDAVRILKQTFKDIEQACFGPITRKHAYFLQNDHTFGNSDDDIQTAKKFFS